MALAVPAAGGVQRAFGTDAKSLQVGLAVDAGLRAARLAAAGARADPAALDTWLALVGGDPSALDPGAADPSATDPSGPGEPLIPNGLAIKLYPCCYALQRPIAALAKLGSGLEPAAVRRIVLRTPEATVVPLIHHRPESGLQGKFSLEYAAAAALLDSYPGFGSFTDGAVRRDAARRLVGLVETTLEPGGDGLLDGELEAEIHLGDGTVRRARLQYPPGSPPRPPTGDQLRAKLADCVGDLTLLARAGDPSEWTWENVPGVLRQFLRRSRAWMS
jgi:2-methylcitrate dehydratase PrpD